MKTKIRTKALLEQMETLLINDLTIAAEREELFKKDYECRKRAAELEKNFLGSKEELLASKEYQDTVLAAYEEIQKEEMRLHAKSEDWKNYPECYIGLSYQALSTLSTEKRDLLMEIFYSRHGKILYEVEKNQSRDDEGRAPIEIDINNMIEWLHTRQTFYDLFCNPESGHYVKQNNIMDTFKNQDLSIEQEIEIRELYGKYGPRALEITEVKEYQEGIRYRTLGGYPKQLSLGGFPVSVWNKLPWDKLLQFPGYRDLYIAHELDVTDFIAGKAIFSHDRFNYEEGYLESLYINKGKRNSLSIHITEQKEAESEFDDILQENLPIRIFVYIWLHFQSTEKIGQNWITPAAETLSKRVNKKASYLRTVISTCINVDGSILFNSESYKKLQKVINYFAQHGITIHQPNSPEWEKLKNSFPHQKK